LKYVFTIYVTDTTFSVGVLISQTRTDNLLVHVDGRAIFELKLYGVIIGDMSCNTFGGTGDGRER